MYAITRADLSVEQRGVQCGHALLEATRAHLIPADVDHPRFVWLQLPDEAALRAFRETLVSAGLRHAPFFEPDRRNQLTAVAVEPVYGQTRDLFKDIPLVKAPKCPCQSAGPVPARAHTKKEGRHVAPE